MSKDKILAIAAREEGFRVNMSGMDEGNLRGRLRILHLRGFLYIEKRRDCLCYKLTKDTHLL